MIDCTFELNDKAMSEFKYKGTSFPAFSGLGNYVNRRLFACSAGFGPIPPGTYYIVDRQSGGRIGAIRDYFTHRDQWFALYADDGRVDDETFCQSVKRGQFRLHPKGVRGISEGCIVINDPHHFLTLRKMLKSTPTKVIPGTGMITYGRVTVR